MTVGKTFHIQKTLHKRVPGFGKLLTGHGKPQIRKARSKKGVVKKTRARKLNLGRGKWF